MAENLRDVSSSRKQTYFYVQFTFDQSKLDGFVGRSR